MFLSKKKDNREHIHISVHLKPCPWEVRAVRGNGGRVLHEEAGFVQFTDLFREPRMVPGE